MTGFDERVAEKSAADQAGAVWNAIGVLQNLSKANPGAPSIVRTEVPVAPLWRDLTVVQRNLFISMMPTWLGPASYAVSFVTNLAQEQS